MPSLITATINDKSTTLNVIQHLTDKRFKIYRPPSNHNMIVAKSHTTRMFRYDRDRIAASNWPVHARPTYHQPHLQPT